MFAAMCVSPFRRVYIHSVILYFKCLYERFNLPTGTLEAMYCISFIFILCFKGYRDREVFMRKKRMYDGCDYRTFGPFVYWYATPWYSSRLEVIYRKNGEWFSRTVWGWWR